MDGMIVGTVGIFVGYGVGSVVGNPSWYGHIDVSAVYVLDKSKCIPLEKSTTTKLHPSPSGPITLFNQYLNQQTQPESNHLQTHYL